MLWGLFLFVKQTVLGLSQDGSHIITSHKENANMALEFLNAIYVVAIAILAGIICSASVIMIGAGLTEIVSGERIAGCMGVVAGFAGLGFCITLVQKATRHAD